MLKAGRIFADRKLSPFERLSEPISQPDPSKARWFSLQKKGQPHIFDKNLSYQAAFPCRRTLFDMKSFLAESCL